jgi:hypothetical protein
VPGPWQFYRRWKQATWEKRNPNKVPGKKALQKSNPLTNRQAGSTLCLLGASLHSPSRSPKIK